VKTLLLTEEDVQNLLSMDEVLAAVESAFKEKGLGRVQMPAKLYLFYREYNGDLRTMPSYLERLNVSAVKVVNVHPENRSKHGLPSVMAIVTLIDPQNGAPLAIMGGTWVTAMRTGAAGGVAAKYLARKDSKVVGLVGAGAQAKTQLMGLLSLYKSLDKVKIWSRTKTTRDGCVAEAEAMFGDRAEMTAVNSVRDAVEGSDIVVTITPSRQPVVSDDWIEPGTHINCIGADAPGKEELDPVILTRSKMVVDDWEQASHSGEINVPLAKGIVTRNDIWGNIGEVVAGLKEGRTSSDEITVFTSTGLAVQDAVTAELAYKKALERNIGQYVEIV